jgi:hypothetical protein
MDKNKKLKNRKISCFQEPSVLSLKGLRLLLKLKCPSWRKK